MAHAEERISGKAGAITIIGLVQPQDVRLPFHYWSASIETSFQDATGSCSYDPKSGIVWKSSLPASRSLDVEIRGRWRRSVVPSAIMYKLFNETTPVRFLLELSPRDPFVDSYGWVSNFTVTELLNDIVAWTANLKSQGTPGDLANDPINAVP